mmetsp:Transcript_88945/g.237153  ORF Transcript_88945/g.237153 Transcript_88945/m.237153 type:complete len:201 (-) Transcript_88945:1138-1740(-)
MACDRSYGLCSVPSSFPVTITVTVSQSLPVVQQVGSTPILLFSQPGVLLDPPQYSAPNLLQNSTLYQAYVNCPINPIPFAFSTSGSFDLLSMSLIDPPSNFASTGLSTPAGVKLSTPALYPKAAITDNGFDISNVQSYWSVRFLCLIPAEMPVEKRFLRGSGLIRHSLGLRRWTSRVGASSFVFKPPIALAPAPSGEWRT